MFGYWKLREAPTERRTAHGPWAVLLRSHEEDIMTEETPRDPAAAGEVTIAHVTSSLSQIERWIEAVRIALESLDPGMTMRVVVNGDQYFPQVPRRVGASCEPPIPTVETRGESGESE